MSDKEKLSGSRYPSNLLRLFVLLEPPVGLPQGWMGSTQMGSDLESWIKRQDL